MEEPKVHWLDSILAKNTWIARWSLYLNLLFALNSAIIIAAGWHFIPQANAYLDNRIEEWARPKRILRDNELKAIRETQILDRAHFDGRFNSTDSKLDILIKEVSKQ